MRRLQEFKGYTVDERLREFRRVGDDPDGNPHIEFIPFDSPAGRELHEEMVAAAPGQQP